MCISWCFPPTRPNRAAAEAARVQEEMATGSEHKNDPKGQTQDQYGPSLKGALGESWAHKWDELSAEECPRAPYSGAWG